MMKNNSNYNFLIRTKTNKTITMIIIATSTIKTITTMIKQILKKEENVYAVIPCINIGDRTAQGKRAAGFLRGD